MKFESGAKLRELLKEVVKQSKKKGLTINKRIKCLVFSKGNCANFELQIRNLKIKQVQTFKYLASVLIEDGKCDTEI